jgi:vacuolar-type H+-ATPase subunit F/Vma7
MRADVHVLCTPPTAAGIRLLGLVPETVADPELIAGAVDAWLKRAPPAVLLVEESLYDRLPAEVRLRAERSVQPVVVPFPGPTWAEVEGPEARVVELLRRAIGYRVRL